MITVSISDNAAEIARKLDPGKVRAAIGRAMGRAAQLVTGQIQRRRLSGRGAGSLGVVSGRLRQSLLATAPNVSGNTVSLTIGTNVEYAAVHEFGTGPYVIRTRNGKALKFALGGNDIFARKVNHPGQKARHWLSGGIADELDIFTSEIEEELQREVPA